MGLIWAKNALLWNISKNFAIVLIKSLDFFINGKEHPDIGNYVFRDLDKILVSYGDETEEELIKQINSVTDYAKNH